MERLAVRVNSGLYIFGEIGVRHWRVTQLLFICLRQSDTRADLTAGTLRSFGHRDRSVVLLHDYLNAFLDLRQYVVISRAFRPSAPTTSAAPSCHIRS